MIRIRCLGQLSVIRDGSQLPPGAIQPRRMGLLALLAAAGERAQGRERLTGLLWPDSDEERARGSLAQALYSLRKDLGSEDAIQGVRELRLNPEFVETDLWDFETHRSSGSLARAVEEYTGPFLEGFHLPGLAEFDRWREEERAAWAGRHLEVVERLAALAEQGDDRVAAVKWWRRAASQEPHNARLIIRLMRAMARGGDRAGAIRQSEIYAAMLERELELAPDPAVLKEAEAIRKGGQGAGEPASQRTAAPPTIPAPAAGSAPEPVPMPLPVPVALPPRRRRTAPVLAGLLVVAAGVVTFALTRNRPESLEERRVLVAPLSNETGDSTLSLVGPMVAEWVTRGLSETGLVEVMDSRTVLEATRDAGDSASVRDIALGAGVGTLVTGRVYREGDSLRLELKLTDPNTGRIRVNLEPVYAPPDRPTAALPLLSQRVTGAIAVQLDLDMPNVRASASQPPTWAAYQEFLLGMRGFGVDWDVTLRHFLRAKALDSTYWTAALWAGNAASNARRYDVSDSIFNSLAAVRPQLAPYDQASLDYFEGGFVRGEWERSYDGARRMYALAPSAGHAAFALGNIAQIVSRPREAIRILETINLERGWGTAWRSRILNTIARSMHRLGAYEDELAVGRRLREGEEGVGWVRLVEIRALAALGRHEELLNRIDLAMTLPPTVVTWEPFSGGEALLVAAREVAARGDTAVARSLFERAEKWYLAIPEPERNDPSVGRTLARILVAQHRYADADAMYRALLDRDSTSVEHWGGRGVTAARLGDSALAVSIMNRLKADRSPFRFGAPATWAARIAVALDRKEEAVALLHQAVQMGFTRIYNLHGEEEFLALRGFRPFEEFITPRG